MGKIYTRKILFVIAAMLLCILVAILIRLFFSNFLCFCNLRFFFFLTFCESICLFKNMILLSKFDVSPGSV